MKAFATLLACLLLCGVAPVQAQFGPSQQMTPPGPGSTSETDKLKPRFGFFLNAHESTPEAQLEYAQALAAEGRSKKARKQYRALLKEWPSAREAALAQYHNARLLDAAGKRKKTIKAYQYLLRQYTGGFPHNDVLERMYALGETLMHEKKSRWFFGGFSAPERAIPLFEYIVSYGPRWESADRAQFMIGQAEQSTQMYRRAIDAYEQMAVRYPRSDLMPQAAFHRAECLYLISTQAPNSEPAADEAWIALNRFLQRFGDSPHAEVARDYRDTVGHRRAKALYEKGRYYDQIARKPKAALRIYREYLRKFPGSEWTDEAQGRIEVLAALVDEEAQPEPKDAQNADN